MPKITYIENNGKSHTIEVSNGLSVMEGAVQNDIPGIDADCGGGMACATCHVYVKEEWFDKLPKKEDGEEDMLDMAYEPKKNSRLSCQIIINDELDHNYCAQLKVKTIECEALIVKNYPKISTTARNLTICNFFN